MKWLNIMRLAAHILLWLIHVVFCKLIMRIIGDCTDVFNAYMWNFWPNIAMAVILPLVLVSVIPKRFGCRFRYLLCIDLALMYASVAIFLAELGMDLKMGQ